MPPIGHCKNLPTSSFCRLRQSAAVGSLRVLFDLLSSACICLFTKKFHQLAVWHRRLPSKATRATGGPWGSKSPPPLNNKPTKDAGRANGTEKSSLTQQEPPGRKQSGGLKFNFSIGFKSKKQPPLTISDPLPGSMQYNTQKSPCVSEKATIASIPSTVYSGESAEPRTPPDQLRDPLSVQRQSLLTLSDMDPFAARGGPVMSPNTRLAVLGDSSVPDVAKPDVRSAYDRSSYASSSGQSNYPADDTSRKSSVGHSLIPPNNARCVQNLFIRLCV